MLKINDCVLVGGAYLKVTNVKPPRDGISASVSFAGVDARDHQNLWGSTISEVQRWKRGRWVTEKLDTPHVVT